MTAYLVTAALCVGCFLCGWKCCYWFHSRRKPATPEQRVWCSNHMNSHRSAVSNLIDKSFNSGIHAGVSLTKNQE